MKKPITNPAASIREKLLTEFRSTGVNFDKILRRYAYERLLRRLELIGLSDRFVLKGAMLFVLWEESAFRPTRDLDLLGLGAFSEESVREIFDLAISAEIPDGLVFDPEFGVGAIREDQKYGGVRVLLRATLGQARIPLQIDIGFGDAVFPAPVKAEIPSLAGQPRPNFMVYPKETVIAEKFHALTERGLLNSRLKDYHDIWVLAKSSDFDGDRLSQAIFRTFQRRSSVFLTTDLPGLTTDFARKNLKPWTTFLAESRFSPVELEFLVNEIAGFILPPVKGLIEHSVFSGTWNRADWRWKEKTASEITELLQSPKYA